jgi:hypothetical protein
MSQDISFDISINNLTSKYQSLRTLGYVFRMWHKGNFFRHKYGERINVDRHRCPIQSNLS